MSLIDGHNIKKSFGTGQLRTEVLKGVSIKVEAGEFIAIMGKSGAGKSTLLYQLSALDQPTRGEIYIADQNLALMSEAELVKFRLYTLGYIFQDYALIPELSATENICLPLLMRGIDWQSANTTARAALDSVDLAGKYDNLPSQLSGGEQQRVSIARAIAGTPKIIFADEPTANLDSIAGATVIELLRKLNQQGQTIVMVTHEPEYTAYCNRIINLEDGLVIGEEIKSKETNAPSTPSDEYINPVYATLNKLKPDEINL